uniref:Uncharacterized protein n=1 Tax=Amphimedon queenslandica TaxID=400682 RepID=A0A1X7TVW5_AMPQE
PKSAVEHTTLDIYYTQDMATIEYNIPVEIECTGEAPENATVTILCNGTGVVYDNTTEVKYEKKPRNITGLISVPQYLQCNLRVTFSNEAGSSEPFILTIDTTPPRPPYVTSSLPIVSITPTSGPTYTSSSSPTVSVTPIVGPASDPLTMTTGAIIGIASGCFVVVVTLVLLLIGVVVNCGKNIGAAIKLIKVTKQRDENGITQENVAHDGGNDVHVQVLDNAAGQYGGQGQGEVVPNGEGQDEVQEVLQNPLALAELKDVVQGDKTKKNAVRQEQGDGSVEQGIVRTEALVNNADTATPLAQDPVPEPKEVAQTDMIEKQTPRKQDENTKSKSNDKEIESADNARDSKKPTKDKYHKDTYHLKRQLLDPSTCSSVPEPNADQSEYNAYYDEPIVTGETETSDNDQQLPRQFVTISIPRPTAGDHASAIISGTLYKDILVPVLPMPQTSPQEIPSLRQIAQPNPQINEENK